MSGSRDRLGLILPIPALLAAEPSPAHAAGTEATSAGDAATVQATGREEPPEVDIGPCLSPPPPTPPPSWAEAPPTEQEVEIRALFQEGRTAFARGDYRTAAATFEKVSDLAPELVTLRLNTTIMFRLATAAAAESDLAAVAELCAATDRNADVVIAHPNATSEDIARAHAEANEAYEYCEPEVFGPCLSPPPEEMQPCLSIIPPGRRGCSIETEAPPLAAFASLMLLGLRSRRRRDAVERMSDRLPPDVAARLRRSEGDDE